MNRSAKLSMPQDSACAWHGVKRNRLERFPSGGEQHRLPGKTVLVKDADRLQSGVDS